MPWKLSTPKKFASLILLNQRLQSERCNGAKTRKSESAASAAGPFLAGGPGDPRPGTAPRLATCPSPGPSWEASFFTTVDAYLKRRLRRDFGGSSAWGRTSGPWADSDLQPPCSPELAPGAVAPWPLPPQIRVINGLIVWPRELQAAPAGLGDDIINATFLHFVPAPHELIPLPSPPPNGGIPDQLKP